MHSNMEFRALMSAYLLSLFPQSWAMLLFFLTIASLLHQQRSRPFLGISMREVKRSRCANQSKHTPKQTQNTTTTSSNPKNRAPKVYVSPALRTRSRRRSPGVIEQRRAYGEVPGTVATREGTQHPRGKARPARAPWWSASGDLLARTMQDQPRAPHGGQPVGQLRATADTTCGFIIGARPRS